MLALPMLTVGMEGTYCIFISSQARNHQLVIHFSGMTLIADPNAMIASPMYLEDVRIVNKQQDDSSSGKGVSKTGVAFIAVVCTLAVVAVALVAYVVSMISSQSCRNRVKFCNLSECLSFC